MKPAPRNRRSYTPLTPEEQKEQEERNARVLKEWQAQVDAEKRERERVENILNMLEIPFAGNRVDAAELADILMDEKKVQAILTKVRNKAFW